MGDCSYVWLNIVSLAVWNIHQKVWTPLLGLLPLDGGLLASLGVYDIEALRRQCWGMMEIYKVVRSCRAISQPSFLNSTSTEDILKGLPISTPLPTQFTIHYTSDTILDAVYKVNSLPAKGFRQESSCNYYDFVKRFCWCDPFSYSSRYGSAQCCGPASVVRRIYPMN